MNECKSDFYDHCLNSSYRNALHRAMAVIIILREEKEMKKKPKESEKPAEK